jgi:hypothetical protein
VSDYYVAHLPSDHVPYWDFSVTGQQGEPRDTSAAAVAASGLLELSELDPDPARSATYREAAVDTLISLSSPANLAHGTESASILLHGTQPRRELRHRHGRRRLLLPRGAEALPGGDRRRLSAGRPTGQPPSLTRA